MPHYNASKLGLDQGNKVFRFTLVRLLGIGGFAEVWLARNLQTEKDVALKFIHRDAADWDKIVTYLHQELKKLRRAEHPHVVTVYGVHEDEQRHLAAIEMEYLPGGTLLEKLENEPNGWL